MQLLMDSSLILIFLTTFLSLGILQIRKTLVRTNLTFREYLTVIENEVTNEAPKLLVWMFVTLLWSFVASVVVFRTTWSSDAFATMFLARMRLHKVLEFFKYML